MPWAWPLWRNCKADFWWRIATRLAMGNTKFDFSNEMSKYFRLQPVECFIHAMIQMSENPPMSKLVWLHLSDIHFLPTNEWQDSTARTALLKFLAEQLSAHQLKVDLIFCTGDIAFGALGKQSLSQQYAMARQFFDKVLALCGCEKSRLFVVPGNHDINRAIITRAERESWAAWGGAKAHNMLEVIPKGFASFDADTQAAMRRLQEWGEFVADYLPHQQPAAQGHHHYAQIITIAGRKIGIAGFNSAWTCAGNEDDRKLWLAAGPQFDHMRRELAEADLKIGLIHHPLDWFNDAERSIIKQRIAMDAHFWLHGHTHDAWVEPLPGHVTLGAGAVGAHSQDEFGCNLVQLDFDGGRGQVHLYRYKKAQARWIEANDIVPTGGSIWDFALPTGVGKAALTPDVKPDNVSRQRRIDAAAPRHARLGSTIDVIVQMRMPKSPLLGKAQFPSQEKPGEIVQDSRQVKLTHGLAGQTGQLLPAKVKVRLVAPLFNIAGTAEQWLEVPAAKYSEQLVFMLVPTRTGECRINIELLTVDDVHIKTIPLSTAVDPDAVASGYETASLVVDVAEQLGNGMVAPELAESLALLPQEVKQVVAKMPIKSRALLVGLLLSLIAGAGAVGLQWPTFVALIVAVVSPPVKLERKQPKVLHNELTTVPMKALPNIILQVPVIKPPVVVTAVPEAANVAAMDSVVVDSQLDNQQEEASFKACEDAQTLLPCEGYLRDFPTGRYVKVVAVRLVDLRARWAARKPVSAPDTSPVPAQLLPEKDCDVCPEMVMIQGGSFMMGDDSFTYPFDGPVHRVTVRGFMLGKTEVTQEQWQAIMGSNPSWFKECGGNCPVETVSWYDAQDFIKKLNARTGKTYRLPSEAEWEYAARANRIANWHYGDDQRQLRQFAWYSLNSGGKTRQVGTLTPNVFGLHDMHGNIMEWVADCYHYSYIGAPKDGSAWDSDCQKYPFRMLRGGSWRSDPVYLRSAYRIYYAPTIRSGDVGLRVAWTPP